MSTRRIFNYQLSKARRIVENAFRILVATFCIFEKPIAVAPEKATSIVMATCVLCNFFRLVDIPHSVLPSIDQCKKTCAASSLSIVSLLLYIT